MFNAHTNSSHKTPSSHSASFVCRSLCSPFSLPAPILSLSLCIADILLVTGLDNWLMRCVFVYMVLVMSCVSVCAMCVCCETRISFQLRFVFVIWREYVLGGIGTSANARVRSRTTNQPSSSICCKGQPVADVNGCLMQVQIHFTHTHAHAQICPVSHFTIFLLALSIKPSSMGLYALCIEREQNHTCEMSQQAAA